MTRQLCLGVLRSLDLGRQEVSKKNNHRVLMGSYIHVKVSNQFSKQDHKVKMQWIELVLPEQLPKIG